MRSAKSRIEVHWSLLLRLNSASLSWMQGLRSQSDLRMPNCQQANTAAKPAAERHHALAK